MPQQRTPKQFSVGVYDRRHLRNLNARLRRVQQLIDEAAKKATRVAVRTGYSDTSEDFRFDDFPQARREIDALLKELASSLSVNVESANSDAWGLANKKNDALVNAMLAATGGSMPKKATGRWYNKNERALSAFQRRVASGMNLSTGVWRLDLFKNELELSLEMGLGRGKSAAELSRDVRSFLRYPNKLFQRVRDEKGNLRLSRAAAEFHPGQGVYRSSYKNALRLTATETNMAYRTADNLRWQQIDFVLGQHIAPSPTNHPVVDICDELQGDYPKDFKFVGWHPFCKCFSVPKLASQDQFIKYQKAILDGEDVSNWNWDGEVEGVPQAFEDWVKENTGRIVKAHRLPYFATDNAKYVTDIMDRNYPSTSIAEQMQMAVNFDRYVLYFKQSSESVSSLVKKYEEQTTDIGRAFVVNQIKQECASLSYQELLKNGQIGEDWVFARKEFDAVIQRKTTYITTKTRKAVSLGETKMDLLIFKDSVGREFAYPVGAGKELFKATEASTAIQELPPYLSKGIRRVSFLNIDCPADKFWKLEYNNPKHRSMATDGGKTTFYLTPNSVEDFKGCMTHEAGHIIDGSKRRFSASKGWLEACAKDEALLAKHIKATRVSKYAATNDSENFAECMRAYINDHEMFKKLYPNCAAYIRQMAQKLSGHPRTP